MCKECQLLLLCTDLQLEVLHLISAPILIVIFVTWLLIGYLVLVSSDHNLLEFIDKIQRGTCKIFIIQNFPMSLVKH